MELYTYLMNQELTVSLLSSLVERGVKSFVICPGVRCAPLVNELAHQPNLLTYHGFDERASCFFALGIARRERRPVAVITTSGTAAGELLPAAMEAYFLGIPLILVTADRPKKMRLSGAPQTAFQPHLYGIYAPCLYDLEPGDRCDLMKWDGLSPCQINVCFEEPPRQMLPSGHILVPKEKTQKKKVSQDHKSFLDFLITNKPLAVVSALPKEAEAPVSAFLQKSRLPAYIEATSGLREKAIRLESPRLSSCSSILRIGGVPTTRLWRDLETTDHPILSITERSFPGLHRGKMIVTNLSDFFSSLPLDRLPSFDHTIATEEMGPLDEEEALVCKLSEEIPENSFIYLGNSLPIRHWDKVATSQNRGYQVTASRGLNGIDGQISTFLGMAEEGRSNWAIVGDLTALYDLSAPWFLPKRGDLQVVVVVINNRGGRIFDRRFPKKEMLNEHALTFKSFAEMWGWNYFSWRGGPLPKIKTPLLLEVSL